MLGKHTLSPKEETFLRITFDTLGSPGPFRKIVTLSTNIPGQKEVEVTVEGVVREAPGAKIEVVPRRIDLGAINPGDLKTEAFTMTNRGSLPLSITRIYVKGRDLVLYDGPKQGDLVIRPGATEHFEYALRPQKGEHQETIAIESNAKNAPKEGYVVVVRYRGL